MIIEFNNLKELFTFNIKYYRYLNNMSQERLAELCSFSPRYLTDIERGKHTPTINKIEIIAKALNIEPFILFQNPVRDVVIISRMNSARQYNQKSKRSEK